MVKQKQKKPTKSTATRKARRTEDEVSSESSSVEAVTVFWMMSLLATICAEGLAGAVRILLFMKQEGSDILNLLSNAMFFVALVAGIVTLIATFATLRVRTLQPPTGIVMIALVAGSIPLLLFAAGVVSAL